MNLSLWCFPVIGYVRRIGVPVEWSQLLASLSKVKHMAHEGKEMAQEDDVELAHAEKENEAAPQTLLRLQNY